MATENDWGHFIVIAAEVRVLPETRDAVKLSTMHSTITTDKLIWPTYQQYQVGRAEVKWSRRRERCVRAYINYHTKT